MELSVLASNLEPYILEILQNSAFSGSGAVGSGNSPSGGAPSPHDLFSEHHSGVLDRSQAPWVAVDITSAITSHVGLSDPHPAYVHTSIAKTVSANHYFTGTPTFANFLSFNSPDQDSYGVVGRGVIGYIGFLGYIGLAHRNYASGTSYGFLHGPDGRAFVNCHPGTSLYFRSGNIDIFTASPGSIAVSGSYASSFQSDHFASQTTGYRMTYHGALDCRYIFANEMHVKAFIADIEMALNGGQLITKSVTPLSLDMTVPNYGFSTTMTVDAFPGFPNAFVFQSGDTIGIKITTRTNGSATTPGSLISSWVFGTVSSPSVDSANKRQSWTFTRLGSNLINGFAAGGTAFAGSVISATAIVIDFGVSGNGYWETTAIDGLSVTGGTIGSNAPYAQAVTWNLHPIYDRTVRTRTGNLSGVGFSGQWGIYARGANANQYLVASGSGITLQNTTINQYDGSGNLRGSWEPILGIDMKIIGDADWSLNPGFYTMSVNANQSYSFSDLGSVYGGVAGGKNSTQNRVVLYNQSWDTQRDSHLIIDSRAISSNSAVYNRNAYVTIATSRWFYNEGIQHYGYVQLGTIGGSFDQFNVVVDGMTIATAGTGNVTPTAQLDIYRGSLTEGTLKIRGTTYASHFNHSSDESTYIRGGKVTSNIYIGDVNTGIVHIAGTSGNVSIGNYSSPSGLTVVAGVSEGARGLDNVRLGVLGGTPRIILENAGFTQLEIDNSEGNFRFFAPGSVLAQLTSAGSLMVGNLSDLFGAKIQTNGNIHAQGAITTDLFAQFGLTSTPVTASGYARVFLRSSDSALCAVMPSGNVRVLAVN